MGSDHVQQYLGYCASGRSACGLRLCGTTVCVVVPQARVCEQMKGKDVLYSTLPVWLQLLSRRFNGTHTQAVRQPQVGCICTAVFYSSTTTSYRRRRCFRRQRSQSGCVQRYLAPAAPSYRYHAIGEETVRLILLLRKG